MRSFAIPVFLLLALGLLHAQPTQRNARLQVRLWYGDTTTQQSVSGTAGVDARNRSGAGANRVSGTSATQIRVQLQDSYGNVVSERSAGTDGQLEFTVQAGGRNPTTTFRVRVYGADIEESILEGVDPFHGETFLDITVRRKKGAAEPSEVAAGAPKDSTVSLTRLQVPDNARKELDTGNLALQRGDLKGAEPHFRKAIELFPNYDQAYNNLGVVLIRTNRTEDARHAFEQAISCNDKFARAYTNLGKLDMLEKKYQEADELLRKSLQTDPRNPEALTLGAEAAYYTNHLQDAVDDVRLLHGLPHVGFGVGHIIAARSLVALSKPDEAAAQYRLFLQEEPDSPNAGIARAALAKLEASPR